MLTELRPAMGSLLVPMGIVLYRRLVRFLRRHNNPRHLCNLRLPQRRRYVKLHRCLQLHRVLKLRKRTKVLNNNRLPNFLILNYHLPFHLSRLGTFAIAACLKKRQCRSCLLFKLQASFCLCVLQSHDDQRQLGLCPCVGLACGAIVRRFGRIYNCSQMSDVMMWCLEAHSRSERLVLVARDRLRQAATGPG